MKKILIKKVTRDDCMKVFLTLCVLGMSVICFRNAHNSEIKWYIVLAGS